MLKRAVEAGAPRTELVMRMDVFLRDKWICHVCNEFVPEHLRPGAHVHVYGELDPLKPTVDHVIPLARGGDHTMANCKTAHSECNSRENARDHPLTIEPAPFPVAVDPSKQCSVDGCSVRRRAGGMCKNHYNRKRTTGDPLKVYCGCGCKQLIVAPPDRFGNITIEGHGPGGSGLRTIAERLSRSVRYEPVSDHGRSVGLTDDCHIWIGALTGGGYGLIRFKNAVATQALLVHRAAYAQAHGDEAIVGMVIDHLCRVRTCFNVNHLEAVTNAENIRRGMQLIETCPKGHPYTEDNLRTYAKHRACLQCHRNTYHLPAKGHEFVLDTTNPPGRKARCAVCQKERDEKNRQRREAKKSLRKETKIRRWSETDIAIASNTSLTHAEVAEILDRSVNAVVQYRTKELHILISLAVKQQNT